MTAEERAAGIVYDDNATVTVDGPIRLREFICEYLERRIAEAIEEAVAEERERLAVLLESLRCDHCGGRPCYCPCQKLSAAEIIRAGDTPAASPPAG